MLISSAFAARRLACRRMCVRLIGRTRRMTILALFTAFLAATGVSGVVRDARTHTPLAGVRVEALSTHDTTTTDAAGRFALPVSPPVRLRFSRGGYTTTDRDAVADSGLVVRAGRPRCRVWSG